MIKIGNYLIRLEGDELILSNLTGTEDLFKIDLTDCYRCNDTIIFKSKHGLMISLLNRNVKYHNILTPIDVSFVIKGNAVELILNGKSEVRVINSKDYDRYITSHLLRICNYEIDIDSLLIEVDPSNDSVEVVL